MGSRGVFQPVGQKRLTNIAVVRLKKAGNRFEIAAYQNKVRDWRNGIEKSLDDVLQTTAIFSNVSKGILAKEKDLLDAFGTTDQEVICLEILKKGELQVADKERKMEYDNLFRDVAGVLVEKCINPQTSRPYTITMLERALRDIHFNVDPKKAAKQQALEALPLLQAKFPIERARMRLKLTAPSELKEEVLEMVRAYDVVIESVDHAGAMASVVAQVEPGAFRDLHNRMQAEMQGKGRVEVLAMTVVAESPQLPEFADPFGQPLTAPLPLPVECLPSASAADGSDALSQVQQARGAARHTADDRAGEGGAGTSSRDRGSARAGLATAAAQPVVPGREGELPAGDDLVYPCGPIAGLPEEHASRRERFAELESLQPGWQVEMRSKGAAIEAVFFSPAGEKVGAFANARRMALAAHKGKA